MPNARDRLHPPSSLPLMVLTWGADEPSITDPSVSMTMAFASSR
jgi:hypothetical protein